MKQVRVKMDWGHFNVEVPQTREEFSLWCGGAWGFCPMRGAFVEFDIPMQCPLARSVGSLLGEYVDSAFICDRTKCQIWDAVETQALELACQ